MKDNKLLAEYLGVYFDKMETAWLGTGKGKGADFIGDWRPNSNWNQLMMVVEKIAIEEKVNFNGHFFLLNDGQWAASIIKYSGFQFSNTFIGAVYNACVGYIKSK